MEKFEGNFSENEDDPEVYESSGDEWNEDEEEEDIGVGRKRGNTRSSQRLSKKPRVSHIELSSDDDESKPKSKNGIKRQKVEEVDVNDTSNTSTNDTSSPTPGSKKNNLQRSPAPGSKINAADFVNGGFLILKKDAQVGDSSKQPSLWRIDGKALLQKYEPFEDDGLVKHRNTSIYTGWSAMEKDQYYPVTVKVLQHQGQNMTVELNWEKLREINNESE